MRRLIDKFFASICVDPKIRDGHGEHRGDQEPRGARLGASVLPEHAVSTRGDDTRVRLISVANHPLQRHLDS